MAIKILLLPLLLISSFELLAQNAKPVSIDTSVYSFQTSTIQGEIYEGFLNPNGFYLLNSKNDTILKKSGDYFAIEFKDFNEDGNNDIFLDKGGNMPEWFDLLLYAPSPHNFKIVKGFDAFPAPEQISGTKYFFSYHKSGCADMNWDSDLFYIDNFKAIKLGNISGRECENNGINDGLHIYKVQGNKKNLLKTLPIETIGKYKDYKWGFIKDYWTINYKQFL